MRIKIYKARLSKMNNNTKLIEVNASDKIEYQLNKYANLALCWGLDMKNDVIINKVFIPAKGETFKIFHNKIVLSKDFIWKKDEEIQNTPQEENFCYETLDKAFETYKEFIKKWPEWKTNKEYWKYIEETNINDKAIQA